MKNSLPAFTQSVGLATVLTLLALAVNPGAIIVWAQAGDRDGAKIPSFSVVSIRPSAEESHLHGKLTPDGVDFKGRLDDLISWAYGQQSLLDGVLGTPSWAEDLYEVKTKVDEADVPALSKLSDRERASMLQAVLVERFHLKAHWESRDVPTYSLRLAKGGIKLKPAQTGLAGKQQRAWDLEGQYKVTARGISIPLLCTMLLDTETQRQVVDETGLTGAFDFSLQWSRAMYNVDSTSNPSQNDAPGIFAAVKQQLGLKLVPSHTLEKVLVVDSIERPTAN